MSRKINTATTDEPWWYLDKPNNAVRKMFSGRDGYPKTELMGKLHFLQFAAAKQALLDHVDHQIVSAQAKLDGLKVQRRTAASLKEAGFPKKLADEAAAVPVPPPLPREGEADLGKGEIR